MKDRTLYNFVLHCVFGGSDRVRVVGVCGETYQQAFRTAIRMFGGTAGAATLVRVASQELTSTWKAPVSC